MIARRKFLIGAGGLLLGTGPGRAAVNGWPTRTIRLLTPWPAGGPLDTFLRLCQPHVSAALGQTIFIDNKSGASGVIGTVEGKLCAPDGYTVIATGASFVTQPLVQKVGYDVERDFAPISRLVVLPQVLAVHPDLPAKTLADFVQIVREKPDVFNYASYGVATTNHFAMEILKLRAGLKIQHIAYRGGAPAMQDTLGGRAQALFTVVGDGVQYFKTGQLKPLALAHPERLPELPDVPTFAELGYQELSDVASAFGIVVPIATPEPIRRAIGDAFRAAVKRPDVASRLKDLSMIPVGTTEDGYRDVMRSETIKYGEVIRVAGIKVSE